MKVGPLEGVKVGSLVDGDTLGEIVGYLLGDFEGLFVGLLVTGDKLGIFVGSVVVGDTLGEYVGYKGLKDGSLLGPFDGDSVGLLVVGDTLGDDEGSFVAGDALGKIVGYKLGFIVVGLDVGLILGPCDGVPVGSLVMITIPAFHPVLTSPDFNVISSLRPFGGVTKVCCSVSIYCK